jgi:hypothetical protein
MAGLKQDELLNQEKQRVETICQHTQSLISERTLRLKIDDEAPVLDRYLGGIVLTSGLKKEQKIKCNLDWELV